MSDVRNPMTLPYYNLLDERWIPIRRASGREESIAPFELTSQPQDPILAIATVRADFDGALLQMLVALLQTTAAPATPEEWRKTFQRPPAPSALRERMQAVHAAFFLDGERPRFLQCPAMSPSEGRRAEMADLLLDRSDTRGHYGRCDAGVPRRLSRAAAAMALLTLQQIAPVGGRGHMASPRGGGPLTTLLQGPSLWQTLWLNVLCEPDALALPGDPRAKDLGAIFPWMGTRTGEDKTLSFPDPKSYEAWVDRTGGEKGWQVRTDGIHPLHVYWAMPRRVLLDCAGGQVGPCDLTGEVGPLVTGYWTVPNGIRYRCFVHPLSPHRMDKKGEVLAVHGGADGIPYRDWPGLSLGSEREIPARILRAFHEEDRGALLSQARLRVFGYEVIPAQTVCVAYRDTETPMLYLGRGGDRQRYAEALRRSTEVSETVRSAVQGAVAAARGGGAGEASVLARTFFAETEPGFIELAGALREEGPATEAYEAWLRALYRGALSTFDAAAAGTAPLRALDARRRLAATVTPRHPKLRERLGLGPFEERPLGAEEQAAAAPAEPPPPDAFARGVFRFWLDLTEDQRERAALRRCASVDEVRLEGRALSRLRKALSEEGFDPARVSNVRLATIAVVLARVRDNAAQKRVGECLRDLPEQKFRKALSDGAELRPLLRLVEQLRETAPVVDLSRSILFFGPTVQQRWAADYYNEETPS